MRCRPLSAPTAALAAALALTTLAGCASAAADAAHGRHAARQSTEWIDPARAAGARPAPTAPFTVAVRTLVVNRGGNRPMDVTLWYPSRRTSSPGPAAPTGAPAGDDDPGAQPTVVGGPAAAGRFPIVIFSHGLNGSPANYEPLLLSWAAAGFVVAAPAFPHTARHSEQFNVFDVIHQPADVSFVLTRVLALNRTDGDPLRGHLDPTRVAATGHSAGGITTVGLFSIDRDERFTAGVVLAGNALGVGTDFTGPAAPLLFVHGDRDPLVLYSSGRDTYRKVPWHKAFLTLGGANHSDPYLGDLSPLFDVVAATTTDFLRWSLYGDAGARQRLAADAAMRGPDALDDQL